MFRYGEHIPRAALHNLPGPVLARSGSFNPCHRRTTHMLVLAWEMGGQDECFQWQQW